MLNNGSSYEKIKTFKTKTHCETQYTNTNIYTISLLSLYYPASDMQIQIYLDIWWIAHLCWHFLVFEKKKVFGVWCYQVTGSSGIPYICFVGLEYCECPAYRYSGTYLFIGLLLQVSIYFYIVKITKIQDQYVYDYCHHNNDHRHCHHRFLFYWSTSWKLFPVRLCPRKVHYMKLYYYVFYNPDIGNIRDTVKHYIFAAS